MTLKKTVLVILSLCFLNLCYAQYSSTQIDSLVNYAFTKFNVAGVAIGIVKDGEIIHQKGYGVKSIDTKKSVNKNTLFAIASNSKAFTSVAIAILIEEGKLKWNDKLNDFIPELDFYNSSLTEKFTIIDMLSHRSGLGVNMRTLMAYPDGTDFTIGEIIESFRTVKPVFPLREKFEYNNLFYMVAGELIKRVSGMSYEDFITQKIFEPLDMNNSRGSAAKIYDKSYLATPHYSEKNKLHTLKTHKDRVNSAAGGIYSNASDMCKWMNLHLSEGKYGNNLKESLFTSDNQNEMWKIHVSKENDWTNKKYDISYSGYGLGWFISDINKYNVIEHTGGLDGMYSKVIMLPDINLGIVILTNTSEDGAGIFSSISKAIIDEYLGLEDFGWIDRYADFYNSLEAKSNKRIEKIQKKIDSLKTFKINHKKYIGIYEDSWFGKAEIFIKNKQLWFKCYRSPILNGPMHLYDEDTFVVKWEYYDSKTDVFAKFSDYENGILNTIILKDISIHSELDFNHQYLNFRRVD